MAEQIYASTLGAPLARFLQTPRLSRVIARFDSTLQLESDDGQLWAITARDQPGAFRALVPQVPSVPLGTKLELRWNNAEIYDPLPARRALTMDERRDAARRIASEIGDWRLAIDTRGAWDEIADAFAIARSVPHGCEERSKAISKNRLGDCFAKIARNDIVAPLIGRGTGLTPTGDDFLQALLVTLSSGAEQDRRAFDALARAVEPFLPRTTRVSGAFLREALNGWAFGALKEVLDDLPRVNASRVRALLNIGATSGTAYALGVLAGLWLPHSPGA